MLMKIWEEKSAESFILSLQSKVVPGMACHFR
jgi:hypothetical protein